MEAWLPTTVLTVGSACLLTVTFLSWKTTPTKDESLLSRPALTVGVFGAGAVGVVAGLKLIQRKKNNLFKVFLIGRSSLETAVEGGGQITLVENCHEGRTVHFDASGKGPIQVINSETQAESTAQALQQCHVILVATKTVATQHIAQQLSEILCPKESNVTIVSLQNGLDNAQILRQHFQQHTGGIQVFTSVVTYPSEWQQHSANFHLNVKQPKMFVEHPSSSSVHLERVQTLVRIWKRANLTCKVTTLISTIQHVKFLTNMINPINALAAITVPEQMMDPGYRQVLASAIWEASRVLCRCSSLSWLDWMAVQFLGCFVLPRLLTSVFPNVCFVWLMQYIVRNKILGVNYKSSMLHDLERRRPKTEMDDLSGYIVRLAAAQDDVAAGSQQSNKAPLSTTTTATTTPIHSALCKLIEQAERAQSGSPKMSSRELCQTVGLTVTER